MRFDAGRALLLLIGLICGTTGQVSAQPGPARGALLVAEPALTDSAFERTVVLLLHHGEDGALGLILNRPTEVRAREALGDRARLGDYDEPVFIGGPVAPAAIAVLVRRPPGQAPADTLSAILDDVYVSGNLEVLTEPAASAEAGGVRLFAGHAAWQAGQLEQEIAGGAWRVVAGTAGHIFTSRPLALWELLSVVHDEQTARRNAAANGPATAEAMPAIDALRVLR